LTRVNGVETAIDQLDATWAENVYRSSGSWTRKQLAREAEALVVEQASVEQSFAPSDPPPSPVPTTNENGKLIWEEPQRKSETR